MTKEELEKEAEDYAEENKEVDWEGFDKNKKELKQAYLAGAEPREKRIAELIALINAERERQEKCDDVHLRTIAELEKENAELKKKNLDTQDAVTMQMYTNKANKEIADRQLTKAKDHIKKLLDCLKQDTNDPQTNYYVCQYMDKAEQFLNSEVEK